MSIYHIVFQLNNNSKCKCNRPNWSARNTYHFATNPLWCLNFHSCWLKASSQTRNYHSFAIFCVRKWMNCEKSFSPSTLRRTANGPFDGRFLQVWTTHLLFRSDKPIAANSKCHNDHAISVSNLSHARSIYAPAMAYLSFVHENLPNSFLILICRIYFCGSKMHIYINESF